jgi:hypothetical protein
VPESDPFELLTGNPEQPKVDETIAEPIDTIASEANMSREFVLEFSGSRRNACVSAEGSVASEHRSRTPAGVVPNQARQLSIGALRGVGTKRLLAGVLLAVACIARGIWGAFSYSPSSDHPQVAQIAPERATQVPIELLRVGQRVLTDAKQGQAHETAVDPRTWRRLRLEVIEMWADGTHDDIHVETLQPPEWVREHGAEIGASVPLPLDLVEMGLPDHLRGNVIANDPCPKLQRGPGRVILTTVNHLNPDVLELSLRARDGTSDTLRPTAFHKFYSDTRGLWLSAADIHEGETLQGVTGSVTVARIHQIAGVHRVYNMTVEGEHVYRVARLGVLVHNNGCAAGPLKGPRYTEPTLPPKTIVQQDGVLVEHYYRSGDHGPAHAHVSGQGPDTRVGANGKPLAGDPELSGRQGGIIVDNIADIRGAINKINQWLTWNKYFNK